MKKLSIALLFIMTIGMVYSCKKDQGPQTGPEEEMEVTIGTVTPGQTEVSVDVKMENVASYAYAVFAAGEEIPDAAGILSSHENMVPETSEFAIVCKELEADKDYVFALAVKALDDETTQLFTSEFRTANWTHVLTILEEGRDYIMVHVECSSEQYWKYVVFEYYDYQTRREAFWPTDITLLPNQNTEALKGPQTFKISKEENLWIRPGNKYMILLGECNAEGEYLYEEKGAAGVSRSEGGLISDEYIDDDVEWTGFFGRRLVMAAPAIKSDVTTLIEEVKVSTRNASFQFTPDDGAYAFTAGIISQDDYDTAVKYVGEDGMPGYFSSFVSYSEPIQLNMTSLNEGQYYVICVTFSDETQLEQNLQVIPFRRAIQSQPAAVLEVKGIDAPEGESATGPYYCWFNVKAPNKDAQYGTYVTMSYDEFVNKVQFGSSAYDMISSFIDQAQFTPEALAEVNSDAGLNICINAWEDSRYVLVGGIANEEDVITTTVGVNQTPAQDPESRSGSDLFSRISGEWTVSAVNNTLTEEGTWQEFLKIEAKTTFALSPYMEDIPSSIPEDVYQLYEGAGVCRNMTDAYFEDLKETAVKMEQKYYDRNWIVASSFELGWQTGWGQTWTASAFESPWGLFTSPSYNGYGNFDIFMDYGPKLFFHVGQDGNLTLRGSSSDVPAASGSAGIYVFACNGEAGADGGMTLYNDVDFPIEISADGNTLTIKPVEKDGEKYYFTLARQNYMGVYDLIFFSTKDVVITRGWNHDTDDTITENLIDEPARVMTGKLANGQRITRVMPQHAIPSSYMPKVYKQIEYEMQSPAEIIKSANYMK